MKSLKTLIVFFCTAQLASCTSFGAEVPDTKWFEKLDFSSYDECYSDNIDGERKNTVTICLDSRKKPVQYVHFPNPGYEHSADCMAYGEYLKRTDDQVSFQTGRGICNNGNLLAAKRHICVRSGEDELLCTSDWEDGDRKWNKGKKQFSYERIKETSDD